MEKMAIAVTKLSSKGQVVIPLEIREGMKEGETLVIIKSGRQIILEKASAFADAIKEELAFAKMTEEAMKRYLKGGFIKKSGGDFLKELEKW